MAIRHSLDVAARVSAELSEIMVNGLTARLIGDGVLDADEDATLLAEIDELVRHYGADAVAETFNLHAP